MQSFVEVIRLGSFSEAAKTLGLSRPLVSRHVTDLEKHLGVRLLTRTTRRITLTEAGADDLDKTLHSAKAVHVDFNWLKFCNPGFNNCALLQPKREGVRYCGPASSNPCLERLSSDRTSATESSSREKRVPAR